MTDDDASKLSNNQKKKNDGNTPQHWQKKVPLLTPLH